MIDSAAKSLEGKTLDGGWTVVKKIQEEPDSTGGFFSVPYEVENDGNKAFLKALDFISFFRMDNKGKKLVDIVQEMTEAYKFERDLLLKCKGNNLGNVIRLLGEGELDVDGHTIGNVPYLIFEIAENDIRSELNFSKTIDNVWKLKSLHNVAKGLKQLHSIGVSHQDLKPSNILIMRDSISKIGDLGRSVSNEIEAPHHDAVFAGDFGYAPPEILYGFREPEWEKRVLSIDIYLLGSLVVFYFTGLNMNAILRDHIDSEFVWDRWRNGFEDVKPYLIHAFEDALNEVKENIEGQEFKDELMRAIKQLCNPDPERRGHPKNIHSQRNSFSLERYVTLFDRLSKELEYNMIN